MLVSRKDIGKAGIRWLAHLAGVIGEITGKIICRSIDG